MKTSLSAGQTDKIVERICSAMAEQAVRFPGDMPVRQPVHVVYGGAHLFRSDTSVKLGRLAVRAFEEYAPDGNAFAEILGLQADVAETVYSRVAQKLESEAVEDLRIDFEDGYGIRPETEEDGHAVAAAREIAAGMTAATLPPFCGIRIKSLSAEAHRRAIRTLDLFLSTLVETTGGELPENFVITLPKVVSPVQVTVLADILDLLEASLGLTTGAIKFEIMIETPHAIVTPDGRIAIPALLDAARGRLRGAHFGAYDYTASLGITSATQDMLHQTCDHARNMMQLSFAGTGVRLSDGATNVMPIGPHRGEDLSANQLVENRAVVHRAWRLHYEHCRHSLANGFYQGWDLHPAQIPTRYAAVYAFFLENLDTTGRRLKKFIEMAAQATLVGDIFDDAATGQGLLNYFQRAINCGAVTVSDAVSCTGLTAEDLNSGSFATIIEHQWS